MRQQERDNVQQLHVVHPRGRVGVFTFCIISLAVLADWTGTIALDLSRSAVGTCQVLQAHGTLGNVSELYCNTTSWQTEVRDGRRIARTSLRLGRGIWSVIKETALEL
jgi:hypothetical protein